MDITLRTAAELMATYPGVRFRSYNRLIKIEQEGTVNVCVEEAMAQAYGVPPSDDP